MAGFKHILCALTELQQSDELVQHAISLSQHFKAKLTVMLSIEPLPPHANMVMESLSYIETFNSLQKAAQLRLGALKETYSNEMSFETLLKVGRVSLEVSKAVDEIDADLVIKKTKTDLLDRLFGSEDMRLLCKCPVPVWLTHDGDSKKYRRVIAAVDVNYHYSDDERRIRQQLNECVTIHAAQIAAHEKAELTILHVLDDHVDTVVYDGIVDFSTHAYTHDTDATIAERKEAIEHLLQPILSANPDDVIDKLHIQTTIESGSARIELPRLVNQLEADLLVMGTVARVGIPGFLMGNTAESILNQVNCSVLALKPQGFLSPLIT